MRQEGVPYDKPILIFRDEDDPGHPELFHPHKPCDNPSCEAPLWMHGGDRFECEYTDPRCPVCRGDRVSAGEAHASVS